MSDKIYVWDPFIRFFHWTLVLAFIIAYLTGDEENTLHVYSGYYILGLVVARILWGLIGTRYARFSNFIYSPSATLDYLKGLVAIGSSGSEDSEGSDKKYIGHNPAGSWMVIVMLISLILTGLSGLKVYGIEGQGPLAQNPTNQLVHERTPLLTVSSSDRDDHEEAEEYEEAREHEKSEEHEEEEFWEEIHEFLANFTVFLVFLHIGGVLASSLKQHQNLTKSMWTGYKRK